MSVVPTHTQTHTHRAHETNRKPYTFIYTQIPLKNVQYDINEKHETRVSLHETRHNAARFARTTPASRYDEVRHDEDATATIRAHFWALSGLARVGPIDRTDGNVHDGCVDRALVHFDFNWI